MIKYYNDFPTLHNDSSELLTLDTVT